mmetsp:Transcript_15471/g.22693  ORF Transcript_15471/g.22693 Transcript_15471/m.22693 type:complete len:81 (+) Transcript_15471:239-481(+)
MILGSDTSISQRIFEISRCRSEQGHKKETSILPCLELDDAGGNCTSSVTIFTDFQVQRSSPCVCDVLTLCAFASLLALSN